jgi:hypothetical protein
MSHRDARDAGPTPPGERLRAHLDGILWTTIVGPADIGQGLRVPRPPPRPPELVGTVFRGTAADPHHPDQLIARIAAALAG